MSRVDGDLQVTGTLQAGTVVLSNASVADVHVQANANIKASKMINRYRQFFNLDEPKVQTKCIHVVQSSLGATLNTGFFGAKIIDAVVGNDANLVIDIRQNGTSILPQNAPIAFVAANHTPPAFSAGTYITGKIVLGNDAKYYRLIGAPGSYSTNPGGNADPTHWSLVTLTLSITADPPAIQAYMSPTLAVSALAEGDWLEIAILSMFTGTYTVYSISTTGSTTTSIKTAATLTAGQTGTMITGTQVGRTFTVVSGSAPTYTVTSNFTAGPANGDLFTLSAVSNVGVSTPTLIYTAATLGSAGSTYTMSSGPQAGRYFTVVSGPSGGAYVVTSNMTGPPSPGDTFGPGTVPQGLYVCLEIDESPQA